MVTKRELDRAHLFVVDIRDTVARTDTAAADGQVQFYRSGSTIRMRIFDRTAGAWRETTLS